VLRTHEQDNQRSEPIGAGRVNGRECRRWPDDLLSPRPPQSLMFCYISLIAIKSLASVQDRPGMVATSAHVDFADHGLRMKRLKIERNHLSERDGTGTDTSDSCDGPTVQDFLNGITSSEHIPSTKPPSSLVLASAVP